MNKSNIEKDEINYGRHYRPLGNCLACNSYKLYFVSFKSLGGARGLPLPSVRNNITITEKNSSIFF